MGSSERRARDRDDVRRRILDAARELFAKEGYEAVTMRRIADRIEYTPPALYFHFKDKLELLQAVCQEDFGALAGRFASLGEVTDPWERLARMGRVYVDFAVKNPNHYRLMFMTKLPPEVEAKRPDGGDVVATDAYLMVRQLAAEAIAAGSIKPEFRDADLVAQILWSAMHGLTSLSITMCEKRAIDMRPTDALTDAMIDTLMRGMASPAARSAESSPRLTARRPPDRGKKPKPSKSKARR